MRLDYGIPEDAGVQERDGNNGVDENVIDTVSSERRSPLSRDAAEVVVPPPERIRCERKEPAQLSSSGSR